MHDLRSQPSAARLVWHANVSTTMQTGADQ